jgi:hypothetical protein
MIDDGGTSLCFCLHVDRRSCYSEKQCWAVQQRGAIWRHCLIDGR